MKKKYYYGIRYLISLGKCFSVGTVTGPAKASFKSKVNLTLNVDHGYKLSFLKVVDESENIILNIIPDSAIIAGEQTYTFTMPKSNVTVSADFEQIIDGYFKGHPYVNINGTRWATCNVGADSPEKIGQQFAWADTDVNLKRYPYWYDNLPYCYLSNYKSNIYFRKKYGSWSNEIENSDDAACKIGELYQTPTVKHFEELIKYTTLTYDSEANTITLTSTVDTEKKIQFYLQDANYLTRNGKSLNEQFVYSRYCRKCYISNDGLKITTASKINASKIRPIYTGDSVPENYVDLGLPSKTKWSLYDLNGVDETGTVKMATSIKEGALYLWGVANFIAEPSSLSGTLGYYGYTKYEKNYKLVAKDDVATIKLGNGWRIPTKDEWQELIDNCDCTWTDNYNNTNVAGCIIVSKENSNQIFLPASGYYQSSLVRFNSHCYYTTSDLCNYTDARSTKGYLFVFTNSFTVPRLSEHYRFFGTSIRPVYAGDVKTSGYIDLGLPSGLKWATCNVGATTPEGYGDYYAYGEIETKTTYTWKNYKYTNEIYDDFYVTFTRYVRANSVLDSIDDAATVNWGSGWATSYTSDINKLLTYDWQIRKNYQCKQQSYNYPEVRMPLTSEWQELMDNCTFSSTTINEKTIVKVTSKINGNYILLPLAGYNGKANGIGYYWPKNLTETDPNNIESIRVVTEMCKFVTEPRFCAHTIRAISKTMRYDGPRGSNAKYVDLGLPSGTYWLDRNVGAENPEDSGNYYYWGSVKPYPDGQNPYRKNNKLTKYCNNSYYGYNGFIDGLTVLDSFDDPATYYYGQLNQNNFVSSCGLEFIAKNDTDPTLSRVLFFPYSGDFGSDSLFDETGCLYLMIKDSFDCDKQTYNALQSWPKSGKEKPQIVTRNRIYGSNVRPIVDYRAILIVTTDGNGIATYTGTVDLGSTITIIDTPNTNYEYNYITVNGVKQTNKTFTIPVDNNAIVQVFFTLVGYNITIAEVQHGTVTVDKTTATAGTIVSLTVTPDAGYGIDTITVNGETITGTSFTMPEEDVTVTATFKKISYTITVTQSTGGTISSNKTTASVGDTVTLTATASSGYTFSSWVVKTTSGSTVTVSNNSFTMPASNVTVSATFVSQEPQAIDLGLSVLWADRNVGAETTDDAGDPFAWGEIETKDTFDGGYKYYSDSSGKANSGYTKYCTDAEYGFNGYTDQYTELQDEDNAVKQFGGYESWDIPTDDDWDELTVNCDFEWISSNPFNGLKVTSKTNQNTIFLPARGYMDGETEYSEQSSLYMSKSISSSIDMFYGGVRYFQLLQTAKSGKHIYPITMINRHIGCLIRPVLREGENKIAVDLGLPSGVKWCVRNLGCIKYTETSGGSGYYYAWGEIEKKQSFLLINYKFYELYLQDGLTKYCYNSNYGCDGYQDSLTKLESGDDAATTNWSGEWRIPTVDEIKELINSVIWTVNTDDSGGLIASANGVSIKFPFNEVDKYVANAIWSSELYTTKGGGNIDPTPWYAHILSLNDTSSTSAVIGILNRVSWGYIRPVKDK